MSQPIETVANDNHATNESDEISNAFALLSEESLINLFNSACREGGPMSIVKALFAHPDVDPSERHNAMITNAAENGHCEIVRQLLKDVRVNHDEYGCLNFQMSCWAGDVQGVIEYLEEFEDDGHGSAWMVDPFSQACRLGRTEVVGVLIKDARVLDFVNNPIPTRLIKLAATNGHGEVVNLFLQNDRTNPGLSMNVAFRFYCALGDIARVRTMLDSPDVDPISCEYTALNWASENKHVDVVKLLLADSRVNPGASHSQAFSWACKHGHISLVKLMLADARVDPSMHDNFPFQLACQKGHADVVQLLLTDPRVSPSASGNEALCAASIHGQLAVVKLLIADRRVEPSARDNIAVRWASRGEKVSVMELLLADQRVLASGGEAAALEAASGEARLDVLQLLLDRSGVIVSNAALHLADMGNHESVINIFFVSQPKVMLRLCSNGQVVGKCTGVLRQTLDRWEARSAMCLLLCVKRTRTPVVAGRVSDVLREMLGEFAKFQLAVADENSGSEKDNESDSDNDMWSGDGEVQF